LMAAHVRWQMMTLEGGLGDKMEDWVELAHQAGARRRRRFCTTVNQEVRVKASEKVAWRDTNPEVVAYLEDLNVRNKRVFKNPRASKSEEARAARVKNRMAALRAFQLKKAEKTASTTSSVCLPSDDVDTMES